MRNPIRLGRAFGLVIMFTIILFLLPLSYLLILHGKIPSFADILQEYRSVGVPLTEILYVGIVKGAIFFTGSLIVVTSLFIGASLIFDVSWKKKRIWGRKSVLHVYFGYYIMIEFMFSMFVNEILQRGYDPRLWGTANAPVLLAVLFILSFSILLAHVATKLPIRIGTESNLGYFIISIYLSYAFFKIMAQGFNVFAFWGYMLNIHNSLGPELVPIYANAFFVLSMPSIFAFIVMVLDRIADKHFHPKGSFDKDSPI